jgi:hypothetical protein
MDEWSGFVKYNGKYYSACRPILNKCVHPNDTYKVAVKPIKNKQDEVICELLNLKENELNIGGKSYVCTDEFEVHDDGNWYTLTYMLSMTIPFTAAKIRSRGNSIDQSWTVKLISESLKLIGDVE